MTKRPGFMPDRGAPEPFAVSRVSSVFRCTDRSFLKLEGGKVSKSRKSDCPGGGLILSALVAVGLLVATALDRNPVRGRSVGLIIGVVGLLATLQLGYRMIAPPFKFEFGSSAGFCMPSAGVLGRRWRGPGWRRRRAA